MVYIESVINVLEAKDPVKFSWQAINHFKRGGELGHEIRVKGLLKDY